MIYIVKNMRVGSLRCPSYYHLEQRNKNNRNLPIIYFTITWNRLINQNRKKINTRNNGTHTPA